MPTLNRWKSKSTNTSLYRAYMNAALEVTGMMAGQRFPLEEFMGNMATHLSPKEGIGLGPVLEKLEDGNYVLTTDGREFFSRRLTDQPMQIGRTTTREEVLEMIRLIVAASPSEGWEAFEVDFPSNV
ncbi:hypothetical protein ACMXYQ_08005 [Neptuniibacter sp. PT34_22]|uniref:hypothetical protein n=1 Tax=Neptuniibacter sp. PT34_22 TaxID=3398205 RepID=UPI0039F592A2